MQLDFFCNSMPELLLLPQPQSKENNKKQSGAILKQKAWYSVSRVNSWLWNCQPYLTLHIWTLMNPWWMGCDGYHWSYGFVYEWVRWSYYHLINYMFCPLAGMEKRSPGYNKGLVTWVCIISASLKGIMCVRLSPLRATVKRTPFHAPCKILFTMWSLMCPQVYVRSIDRLHNNQVSMELHPIHCGWFFPSDLVRSLGAFFCFIAFPNGHPQLQGIVIGNPVNPNFKWCHMALWKFTLQFEPSCLPPLKIPIKTIQLYLLFIYLKCFLHIVARGRTMEGSKSRIRTLPVNKRWDHGIKPKHLHRHNV